MPFFDVEHVARLFQLQPDTIRKKASLGEIEAAKIGKAWRFTQRDIDAYVQKCRHAGSKRQQSRSCETKP